MKSKEFQQLLKDMSQCSKCINLKNKSLINFYHDEYLASRIPSIWTDWFRRLDSKIFIVGQDWGPFIDMKSLYERYIDGETEKTLIF